MDLFTAQEDAARQRVQPLAVRMRPRTLDDFVGQQSIVGPGTLLRRLLEADRLSSAIFYGPPGCGKTSLARVIAEVTDAAFETLHAAESGVKDVRNVIERATARLTAEDRRTVLFLDEIHRFNRAQQDVLLKDVEDGLLILLGATTENPFFTVNGPLLSRSNIFEFQSLTDDDVGSLLRSALRDTERGIAVTEVRVEEDALRFIAQRANGDARRALTALEIAVLSQQRGGADAVVTAEVAAESMQTRLVPYDAAGDTHYDVASALIKSMRGSDPDATLYWLARMLEGGEDPRFIARRIAICASEDVGNADPQALVLAAAAVQVTQMIGLPECQLTLAQAAVYVACAPKSNAITLGIGAARQAVQTEPLLPVPDHLKDAHYAGAARLGRGQDYQYPHDAVDGFVVQDYLGAERTYYNPTDRGEERNIGARLREWRSRIAAARAGKPRRKS